MPGDLEGRLGELAGQLSRLFPTLDRIEQRVHLAEERGARLEERCREHAQYIEAIRARLDTGDRGFESLRIDAGKMEQRTTVLEKAKDTRRGRAWDLAQLFLAAMMGGLVTVFVNMLLAALGKQ